MQQPLRLVEVDLREVPLRQDDEGRAARLAGDVGDRQVLFDHALGGVDEHECDIGTLGRGERAQLRVVLDALTLPALAPQPGRVDEDERRPVTLQHGVDGVPRGARNI